MSAKADGRAAQEKHDKCLQFVHSCVCRARERESLPYSIMLCYNIRGKDKRCRMAVQRCCIGKT